MDQHATPHSPAQTPAREDELLGVIADVEKQLAALRTVKAEREESRQKLEARAAEVAQKERALEAAAQRLAQDIQQAQKRAEELGGLEESLSARRTQLEHDWEALTQEQQKATGERERTAAELEARAQTLNQREQRLTEHAQALSVEREKVDALAAQLAEREKSLAVRFAEAEHARAQAASLQDEATAARRETEKHIAALEAMRRELDTVNEALVATRRDRAHDSEQHAVAMEAMHREVRKAQQELESSRQQHTRDGEAQAQLIAEAEKRQTRLDAAEARVKELSGKLSAAMSKLKEVSESFGEQAELVARARAAEQEMRERDERLAQLASELEAAQARVAELESAAPGSGVLASAVDQGGELDELRARVQELEEGLRVAHEEMTETIAENKELHRRLKKAAKGSGEVPAEVGEAVMRRLARLRLMRQILRDHAEKLNQAGEALRQRYEQCEAVLAQRDSLAAAQAAINQLRAKVERAQTRATGARAVAAVFYAVLIVVALAALSWVFGGQVAPATYAARAVIAADTGGASPAEDVLREWQKFHEGMITDPSLVESAAERMGRRGMVSLATPGALREELNAHLAHQSSRPGELILELRGAGSARTQRVLDTFVTAMVSESNATRERRADGVGATISQAAAVGAPIEDQRVIYAVAVFGLGLGLSSMFGVAVWRKLAKSKLRFEEEQQIDTVLDEVNWRQAADAIRRR